MEEVWDGEEEDFTMRKKSNLFFYFLFVFLFSTRFTAKLLSFSSPVAGITPPEIIYSPPLTYPSGVSVSGEVQVVLDVNEKGYPENISIATHLHPLLDKEALSWASKLRFRPATERGKPVKVRVMIPVRFIYRKKVPSGEIKGYVFEKGTGDPIEGVEVFDSVSKRSAYSDRKGYFHLRELAEGFHKLKFVATGYYPAEISVHVSRGKATLVKIYLTPEVSSLYSIEVIARKEVKEVSEVALPVQIVRKVAGTGGDALRVIQRLPGVGMANELSGKIIVRGSGPYDNLIRVDDVTLPYIYHFGSLTSVLNDQLIEKIIFDAGGFSVKYGNAMGGVIQIITRNDFRSGLHGSAGMGSVMADANFSLGGKSISAFAGGRRSYFDLMMKPVAEAIAGETKTDFTLFPYFYDYQLKIIKPFGKNHSLSLLMLGGKDEMGLYTQQENCEDPYLTGKFYFGVSFSDIDISYHYRSGKFENRFSLLYGSYERDWEVGTTDYIFTKASPVVGAREEFHVSFTPQLNLLTGGDLSYHVVSVDSLFPPLPKSGERTYTFTDVEPIRDHRKYHGTTADLYGELEIISGKLHLYPGIRSDFLSQGETRIKTFDPRIRFRYEINNVYTLKGAVGIFHQFPSYTQIDPVYGNPHLTSSRAVHYIAGMEAAFSDLFDIDIQAYYKRFSDLVVSYITFPRGFENSGIGYSWGFDFMLRKHFTSTSHWWGWFTYSYSRSRRKYLPDSDWTNYGYDRPDIINLVVDYVPDEKWEIGASWKYAYGNPYTVVKGSINIEDTGIYIPVTGSEKKRNPPYHRLDLRVERKFLFNRWKLSIFTDIANLYFHLNPTVYVYDYDYARRIPVALVPFMMNFGIRGEF